MHKGFPKFLLWIKYWHLTTLIKTKREIRLDFDITCFRTHIMLLNTRTHMFMYPCQKSGQLDEELFEGKGQTFICESSSVFMCLFVHALWEEYVSDYICVWLLCLFSTLKLQIYFQLVDMCRSRFSYTPATGIKVTQATGLFLASL